MDIVELRDYCMSLPMTEESTPFDETTLVFKIGGRMYAYADMVDFRRIGLKCDPDLAEALRERYAEITGAWHSNKRHWNDVYVTGDLPDDFIREQIRNSYMLVLHKIAPRTLRDEIICYVDRHGLPER